MPIEKVGFFLVLTGVCALSFLWLIPRLMQVWFRYLWLWFLLIFLGIGLFDWRILLSVALLIGSLFLFGPFLDLRDRLYAKHFPIFATAPTMLTRCPVGYEYRLHIAQVKAGYIIGVSYDEDVDGDSHTTQTRWRDVFSTYELAEKELMKRGAALAARYGSPHPSIERTSPGKPGDALSSQTCVPCMAPTPPGESPGTRHQQSRRSAKGKVRRREAGWGGSPRRNRGAMKKNRA